MVSARAHYTKKASLATDEFWHGPIATDTPAKPIEGCDFGDSCSSSSSSSVSSELPPAHHQLLCDEAATTEDLKGYDHTASMVSYGDLDASTYGDSDDDRDVDSSFCSRQKLSAVKKEGGGSWLLGFARLSEKSVPSSPEEEEALPGLVRDDDSTDESSLEEDDASSTTSSSDVADVSKPAPRKSVSFNSAVVVRAVPHSSTLAPVQRRRMYSTSYEVRQNKIRNKKEYRYDGYDWRNVTEEWEMGVDMVTGELVHPAHERGV
jgi:hypothetical protein